MSSLARYLPWSLAAAGAASILLLSRAHADPELATPPLATVAADGGVALTHEGPPSPQDQVSDDQLENLGDPLVVPSRLKAPPIATAQPLAYAQDLLAQAKKDAHGHLQVSTAAGAKTLTLDVPLQDKLTKLLQNYNTPYAAVVALDPSTGKVLAMAEHSEANGAMRGLCTKAIFPAASVFKIVTASALIKEGISPDDEACFHGGKRNISAKMLEDSGRDRSCMSLSTALARSANGVFAKLTHHNLTAPKLRSFAAAWHFNQPMDFPVPTDISLAAVPDDALGLASTGAGFGDVYLSPLHGAMLASVVANRGRWQAPVLFENAPAPSVQNERVIPVATADALAGMMSETVRLGTARKVFHQRGFAVKDAAGKTGSLADKSPYRDYSWFVGFAPKDHPQIAVAAVIVNDYKWRIRAPFLAREAIRMYLEEGGHEVAVQAPKLSAPRSSRASLLHRAHGTPPARHGRHPRPASQMKSPPAAPSVTRPVSTKPLK